MFLKNGDLYNLDSGLFLISGLNLPWIPFYIIRWSTYVVATAFLENIHRNANSLTHPFNNIN
jgi:hypothetical protein